MKQAYVSVVCVAPAHTDPGQFFRELEEIERIAGNAARMHEIVIVALRPTPEFRQVWRSWSSRARVSGPVSLMVTGDQRSSYEDALLAGLARCVGDFVLEWEADIGELTPERLQNLLEISEQGLDIVQAAPLRARPSTRAFYRAVNRYSTVGSPLASTVGNLYSRAAVDKIIDAGQAVKHRKVLAAQSGMPTGLSIMDVQPPLKGHPLQRIEEGIDIFITGTRIGTRTAYWLALLAALGGLSTAAYAVVARVLSGQAPEGWVTLMIVTGLSFAAVLVVLALLGEMLSRILKEVQRNHSPQATIEVVAPLAWDGSHRG